MWLIVASILDWSSFVTEPFDKQKAFIQDCVNPDLQFVTACCGLQSGKSLVEADAALAALYGPNPIMLPEGPRGRTPMEVWIVSKSYGLAQAMLETFRWRTAHTGIWADDKLIKSWGLTRDDKFTFYLKPRPMMGIKCADGAPIKLRMRTASDPDGMRATPTLGLVICDELARWKPKSWLNLQARAIVARTKFIAGTTTNGKNFVYRDLAIPAGYGGAVRADSAKAIHTWTSADNPYADSKHIERLRRTFGREYAKQELEGLFTDSIGYVYGEFDRTLMMVDPPSRDPNEYVQIVGGIDPGWTDAFAAGVWGKHEDDDGTFRWYQLWELHETQHSAADLAYRFLEADKEWDVEKWYCDKRRPSDINDLRKRGLNVDPNLDIHAEDDRRTIPVMLALCQGLMQQGRIRIMKDHDWTAEEFENYHYPDPSEDNPKNTQDIPVDWMNHHMDQMRYAICSVEEIPKGGPRYRQGASQSPKEYPVLAANKRIPTISECLAAQDDKMDERQEREQGKGRSSHYNWLRNRIRNRGGMS